MDIKIEKKPWYIRYRYYMIAALAFIIFLIYVISLSLGPRKLRIETDNIQIAEVKDDKFMEYVDVEGLVQPILTIKVNTREAGSVDRIVGEEGNMMKQGDTLLILTNPDLIRSIEDQRYNPQIQISAESETKRSIFREKDKTKRSKKESAQHSKSRNKSFVMTSVSAL